METTTETLTCPACGANARILNKRTWVHYDYDSEWAYADEETVTGMYCDDCLSDIDRIEKLHKEFVSSYTPPTEIDWQYLACRLATAMSNSFSNWKDMASVTKREMAMLTDAMGNDWQRW